MKTLQQKTALCLSLVILCLLISPLSALGISQQEIDALAARQESLRQQRAGLEDQLSGLAQDEAKAVDQKVLLEQKIDVLDQQIQLSQQTIQALDEQIGEKQTELTRAQEAEAAQRERYEERVRAMEERGKVSYLSVLFRASSFSDLLDRVSMIGEIMAYDNQVLEEMAEACRAVAQAKAALEESQSQQQEVLDQQRDQQAQRQAELAQAETVLAQIQSQTNRYGQDLAALESTEDQVAQELAQAEAAYARQLEAQRQAELARQEEAARQAEAARQQAAQQQGQGGEETGDVQQGSGLLWPVPSSHRVSSYYGPRTHPITHRPNFHTGIDIPAAYGAAVQASLSGVVVLSQYHSSYGNYVVVAHGNGMRTLYAHLSARLVSPGQTVSRGQTIGSIGSTGSSTGNHLHYETWTGSSSASRTNPMNYF